MDQENMVDPGKAKNLRIWNLSMGFLHLISGILMLVLSKDFRLPVTTSFLKFDTASLSLQPTVNTLFELKIGPTIAVFLFLSALAHFSVSLLFNKWYNKNIASGINPARWIEYFLSSSLMIVVIAMLVGVYDISALAPIFLLNGTMILFGWMMELHNQSTPKTNWTSFYFGCLAGIIPWIVIAIYLFGAGDATHHAPNFVYWIYFSIFLFFNCFAINQVLQYKKVSGWRDYLYGEKAYIILSLVAKSLLAWQVFAGTLRP